MQVLNLHALSRRLNSTHRLIRLVSEAPDRAVDRPAADRRVDRDRRG